MSTDPTPPPPPPPSAPPPRGGASSVDFGAVPRSVWISLGGAIVLFLSVFFTWYSADVGPISVTASGTDVGGIVWLVFLAALVAIAAWVIDLWVPTVELPVPAWQIAAGAGVVAVILIIIKIIDKPDGWGLSWGIFLALLAAIAVVAGAYMRNQEVS
jgi:hypothetical protein